MNKKKWLLMLSVVILIGGGAWGIWFATHQEAANAKQMIKTETTKAQLGEIAETVTGSGNLSAKYKQTLAASDHATIDEVSVKTGDQVKKGDTLVTFTDEQDDITAPFTGEVTSVPVTAGDMVNAGTELVSMTNYKKLIMNVDIDELDIASIKKGQAATITVGALPDQKLTGKVTKVAKEANEDATSSVAKYAVQLTLDKASEAKPGMTAEATIQTKSKQNVVTVPVEALQKGQDGYYVLLADGTETEDNSAEQDATASEGTKQKVEVGLQTTEKAEIVSGLSEGDAVLIPMFESSSEDRNSKMPEMGPGGDMPQGGKGPGESMPQNGMNGGGMAPGDKGGRN